MINLDEWQKEFISHEGDKILVAGRQTGKSEAQAYDNAEFALNNAGTTAMLISKTQRQSEELLIKTLMYLQEIAPKRIGKGKWKPLKHSVWIMGKTKSEKPSRVMCLPTGLAGEGIRSFTIHKLSVDEAQLVSEDVFTAVTPMLLTTGGKISLTGTPQGRKGFFYQAYENKLNQFKVFHVNSKEVIENREISASWPEWRREAALNHLEREKVRMSDKQFAQEYLGIFVEDLDQVYPDELIARVCRGKRERLIGKNYLGVDVGRVRDPSTFQVINSNDPDKHRHVENIVEKSLTIPQTAMKAKELHKIWKCRKSGIDGGGMGAGVVDIMMLDRSIRKGIVDLNNASRLVHISGDKEKKKSLLKEQMHFNLLSRMQEGKIILLDDDEVKASLRSCQMEQSEKNDDITIFGSDTHIAEGIVRAEWLATQDKSLNLWCSYSGDKEYGQQFQE